jgi:soluble lytic murein transglycosylase-like protein
VRLRKCVLLCAVVLGSAPAVRAEYVVFRSGQRLRVTGYQLTGSTYRLQLEGGTTEVPAEDVVRIEPEEVFSPIPATDDGKAPFHDAIQAAASRYNVDAELITSVIAVESNFNPKAVSRRNARGLMQLLPETASRLGVRDIFDPKENIDAGTRYLREQLQRYNNNLALALAAYNAGPERIQAYGRVPPFTETISYVRRVKRAYAERKSGATVPAHGTKKPAHARAGFPPAAPQSASEQ